MSKTIVNLKKKGQPEPLSGSHKVKTVTIHAKKHAHHDM